MSPATFISIFLFATATAMYLDDSHLFHHHALNRKPRSVNNNGQSRSTSDASVVDGDGVSHDPEDQEESTESDQALAVSEDEVMTDEEWEELDRLDQAHASDLEHYYRIPGSRCSTSEQIAESWDQIKGNGMKARLQHHHLEMTKCLWYTKTYCAAVRSQYDPDEIEYRCICMEGRTWEDGACLAYDRQKCLWDNDCVRGANCKLPGDDGYPENMTKVEVGQESDQQVRRRRRKRSAASNSTGAGSAQESDLHRMGPGDSQGGAAFEWGICVCRPFDECQRSSRYPPLIDEGRGGILLPSALILIGTMLTLKVAV